jgi:hypothetical protein
MSRSEAAPPKLVGKPLYVQILSQSDKPKSQEDKIKEKTAIADEIAKVEKFMAVAKEKLPLEPAYNGVMGVTFQ